ncbi:4a-hydroxytetrahydrobiopterin dehydratase [Virgibacillus phasianinus]|uniref:4a-hydroxytetrahydrobiopterin dehydratase n=1 Tax=Virgibacillus phasianinus TaxID=2017483 RepID=A0A220U8X1_9BACI|nr:4a-hydroxytetrahydrobiopterin dehydratase [Virgibacillus phasianinus]ASK64301.1 4a-hydroxytetrahydrobiopterin dehydratase [Virgibacillus phasianinus]
MTEEQVNNELAGLTDWNLIDEKWIERIYRFKKYLAGVRFVDKVAESAENKQHHPLIAIDYKKVSVKFSSWQEKGLTSVDFEMAKRVDVIYEELEQ